MCIRDRERRNYFYRKWYSFLFPVYCQLFCHHHILWCVWGNLPPIRQFFYQDIAVGRSPDMDMALCQIAGRDIRVPGTCRPAGRESGERRDQRIYRSIWFAAWRSCFKSISNPAQLFRFCRIHPLSNANGTDSNEAPHYCWLVFVCLLYYGSRPAWKSTRAIWSVLWMLVGHTFIFDYAAQFYNIGYPVAVFRNHRFHMVQVDCWNGDARISQIEIKQKRVPWLSTIVIEMTTTLVRIRMLSD